MHEAGETPPLPKAKGIVPRFLERVRRNQGTDTEVPTFTPENLDPKKIANFLGNWKPGPGMPGEWIFWYEPGKDGGSDLSMSISKEMVGIQVGYQGDPSLSINMRGVKTIKLAGEGTYIPNSIGNPRIVIETQDGMIVFYRDDLHAVLEIGKQGEKHGKVSFPPESHIDFGRILKMFRQSRKKS